MILFPYKNDNAPAISLQFQFKRIWSTISSALSSYWQTLKDYYQPMGTEMSEKWKLCMPHDNLVVERQKDGLDNFAFADANCYIKWQGDVINSVPLIASTLSCYLSIMNSSSLSNLILVYMTSYFTNSYLSDRLSTLHLLWQMCSKLSSESVSPFLLQVKDTAGIKPWIWRHLSDKQWPRNCAGTTTFNSIHFFPSKTNGSSATEQVEAIVQKSLIIPRFFTDCPNQCLSSSKNPHISLLRAM